jgi:aminoglycoside N3'-acetyltransferase
MNVTVKDIRLAIHALDLADQPLCVHSSLRSFGHIEGGAQTLLDSLLAEGCTVLVPTFSDAFSISPPPDPAMRPPRNGWNYAAHGEAYQKHDRIYTSETPEINRDMGALPAAVIASSQRVRGDHPLNSFAAIGPLAQDLITGQRPLHVYAPLEALMSAHGSIVLMGVGLERMTFLHLVEQRAGRTLFRRWASGPDHRPVMVEVGSCSEGFGHFAPVLAPFRREINVGQSLWQVFPAEEVLKAATKAIQDNPDITRCDNAACERCNDAVLGGPLLTSNM